MYWRLALAALIVVALAGTHWKAFHDGREDGRAEIQQRWDAERAELTAQALAASEAARAKEQEMSASVERVRRELNHQKSAAAAAARESAARLRAYESALAASASGGDSAADDTGPAGGAGSPFATIAGECGRALTALDEYARGLAATAGALQNYATGVCITVPDGASKGSK